MQATLPPPKRGVTPNIWQQVVDHVLTWFRRGPQPGKEVEVQPEQAAIRVQPYSGEDGALGGALLAINGTMRDQLLQQFREQYQREGDHIRNGGAISPKSMLTLIGGGTAALAGSNLAAGTLYVATANPATLMAIGNGVGSAVMGAGGIIGHAPFVAASAGLMPVLAPLIAFQALSTIMVMNQFKGIHERLERIEKSINRLIQRSEATYVGELLSAANRLEEIEAQFNVCNSFTPEMIIRLALVEDKINPIFERYRFLYESQDVRQSASVEDITFKQNDAYLAVTLSILDLRIDVLKLKLVLQVNRPGNLGGSIT